MNICQATRSDPAVVTVESQSPDGPYQLCEAAAHRLQKVCLRPLEWYNLAVIHGPFEYWLQDDFYEMDGSASQPQEKVRDAASFPSPTLDQVADDLEALLDFAATRWWIDDDVTGELRRVDPDQLLTSLIQRYNKTLNPWHHGVYLTIAGAVLSRKAEHWIKGHLSTADWQSRLEILTLAKDCLPRSEAINEVKLALKEVPPKSLPSHILTLAEFRDPMVIDWIEENICEPLTSKWGDLAAASGIDWRRVVNWLEKGRPLSLVALDAIVACDSPRPNQSPLIRSISPRLINAPEKSVAISTLKAYQATDNTLRVRNAIDHIDENWQTITSQD